MKKILSLMGVLAATAFAPEASALPAFARQTGMECTACHQQHFPVLNGFGRAFKAGGYTMMGAQGLVEGEHLSIPANLNAAILVKVRYVKDNTPGMNPTTGPTNTGNGQLQFGDELSLFFAGRVTENIGFMFEGNTAAVGGALVAGLKLPMSYDLGAVKLTAVPFTTDALSVQYGFELSSGGVMRANRWAESRRETSAIQYNADRGPDAGNATGVALVAHNDMGFINFTKWSPSYAPGSNGQQAATPSISIMTNNYLRVAATPSIGDWAIVAGLGAMRGTGYGNMALQTVETRQTFADLQAHGAIGGQELGVYAQYATAPAAAGAADVAAARAAAGGTGAAADAAGTATVAANTAAGIGSSNAYNSGLNTRKAFTVGADYSVIPHTLSVGAAYRNAKNGGAAGADGDNAITLTAVYDVYQNVALHADFSKYSGSAHNATVTTPQPLTQSLLVMLEAAW